ncbi:histone deacetylase complex subunit SAP30 homolog [Nephila pilipes]|uniref:Histone deacetylase complex subunit SAP30 homolog n=1 Tax=Nephila pilipes TaxID=299642 RepID=A0A8X6MNW3_NEPPI|nr:histone deacetylase complex subunit SAP30 homolog [Nephila pilipes]
MYSPRKRIQGYGQADQLFFGRKKQVFFFTHVWHQINSVVHLKSIYFPRLCESCQESDKYEMNGFSTEEETPGCHNQVCCLLDEDERCTQPAGNASYNKRIQKTVAQKKLKLSIDPNARHIYICEYHKGVIQSIRNKRKRKESEDDNGLNDQDMDIPEVDLYQLQVSALRRYKRHFKIQTRQGVNKAQLAETLSRHFKTIPVNEKEAITYFVYMVKNNKNKLDQKNGTETTGT